MSNLKNYLMFFLISVSWSATITVPTDYSTIQEAINAAVDGDSISVVPGTYYEKINFYGKDIKVVGQDRLTTIIDGSDANSDGGGLINGDFESYSFQNGWQYIPMGWETWLNAESGHNGPSDCCYTVSLNGENVYNSETIFNTYEGAAALKMWGWWESDVFEWNVYQNFFSDQIDIQSGNEINISAMHFQAEDDRMGEGSSFNLFVKYFDTNWNLVQMDLSDDITFQSEVNSWMSRSVSSIVPDIPEGEYLAIQVGMIWFNNSGGGAVYTDQFEMTINSLRVCISKRS